MLRFYNLNNIEKEYLANQYHKFMFNFWKGSFYTDIFAPIFTIYTQKPNNINKKYITKNLDSIYLFGIKMYESTKYYNIKDNEFTFFRNKLGNYDQGVAEFTKLENKLDYQRNNETVSLAMIRSTLCIQLLLGVADSHSLKEYQVDDVFIKRFTKWNLSNSCYIKDLLIELLAYITDSFETVEEFYI